MRSHRCRKPHRARIARRSEEPPAWTRPHTRHQDRQHTRKHTGLTQAHPPHVVYTYNQPGHDHIQGIRTGNTHENIRVSHRHTNHMRCYIQPAGTRPHTSRVLAGCLRCALGVVSCICDCAHRLQVLQSHLWHDGTRPHTRHQDRQHTGTLTTINCT